MSRKAKLNEDILDAAVINAEAIEEIMVKIDAAIPVEKQPETDPLWEELQHRMFYQNYLYDCHQPSKKLIGKKEPVVLAYADFEQVFKTAGVW